MSFMSVFTMLGRPQILAFIADFCHVLYVCFYNVRSATNLGIYCDWGQQLYGVSQGSIHTYLSQDSDGSLIYGEAFRTGSQLDYLDHLLLAVGESPDDEEPVQQVQRYPMWTQHICAPNFTPSPVSGEYNNGSNGRLQGSVKIGEALNIQHVNLVNEENAGDQLSHTIIYIFINHFVNLPSQLVSNLRLLRLHHLSYHGHDVLPTLGPRIGTVQIMKSHILDNFLPLVNIPLRKRNILLSLKIKLRSKCVRPALPLDCPTV